MAKKLSTEEKARRAWVRALRSGKYRWGIKALQPEDGKFCCLGVLCEVAIKYGIIDKYIPEEAELPEDVRQWVGMQTDIGDFDYNDLTVINDDAKRNPFLKIRQPDREETGRFVCRG